MTVYIYIYFFRTPKDFASASDKIWPHFAALKLPRTHKWELVDKGVIKKVIVIAIDTKKKKKIYHSNLENLRKKTPQNNNRYMQLLKWHAE